MKRQQHQNIATLNFLKQKGKITTFSALVQLGVTNLPRCISQLRLKGYNITCIKKAHVNRYGVKIHYNEYFLLDEEQAKNQGYKANK